MELKKSPKVDLQNKRGLFFEIGLTLSLLFVIGMFTASVKEKKIEIPDMQLPEVEQEIIEITRQDDRQPEPVRQQIAVVSDIINIVKDDAKIETSIDFSDFAEDATIGDRRIERREGVVQSDEPFISVEIMPTFQGGDLATFRNWVQGKINYPSIAQENGIQGRVTVTFVIEKDGSLTNIEVMQSPDRSLSDETVRVLKTSPKWTPGRQRNQPARVKFTLPVEYVLQ